MREHDGTIEVHETISYDFGDEDSKNEADSAPHVPKGVVTNPYFDWSNDRRVIGRRNVRNERPRVIDRRRD